MAKSLIGRDAEIALVSLKASDQTRHHPTRLHVNIADRSCSGMGSESVGSLYPANTPQCPPTTCPHHLRHSRSEIETCCPRCFEPCKGPYSVLLQPVHITSCGHPYKPCSWPSQHAKSGSDPGTSARSCLHRSNRELPGRKHLPTATASGRICKHTQAQQWLQHFGKH